MFTWESSFISETVCRPGRASMHSPGRRFSPVLQKPAADLFCGFEQCARLDQAVKLGHLGVHDDIGIDRRDGLADFLIDCRRRGGEERLAAQPQRLRCGKQLDADEIYQILVECK